jgi:5'-deoxynucleotidase YfbR-like HD superfamily hydrolase
MFSLARARDRFEEFLKRSPAAGKLQSDADKEALFKQFQAWEAERTAKAQAGPEKPQR